MTSIHAPTFAAMIQTGTRDPRTWLSQRLGELAVILLICVSILAPNIEISTSQPRVRVELIILILAAAVYGWLLLAGKVKLLRLNSFYLIGALFCFSVIASLAYGVVILHHGMTVRDFTEIPKAWLPILFFSVGYEAELSESGLHRLMNFLAAATILVCLFGWAQFLDLRIVSWLQPYYGDGGHNDAALKIYRRIYATLGNPNVLSQFLSWSLVAYAMAFLYGIGNRLRNVAVSVFCLITIALSGSRYGILAAVVGLLFVLGFAIRSRRGFAKIAGMFFLLAIFCIVFLVTERSSYFATKRFQELSNPLQVSSLRGRLDVLWVDALGFFASSPLVGHGPAKEIFTETYTDSEYLDILKEYGAIGFAIYLAYYAWPLLQIGRAIGLSHQLHPSVTEALPNTLFAIRFGAIALGMALFMNVGMFTCFNWYLMCFLWVWTGLAVRGGEFLKEVCFQQPTFLARWQRPSLSARSLNKLPIVEAF